LYDFGDAEDEEWLVDDIVAHRWEGTKVSFLVQWNLGDMTWELYTKCKDLEALDRYLELLGIDDEDWKMLPRKASGAMSKGQTPSTKTTRKTSGTKKRT
jgi:hypothetical protein